MRLFFLGPRILGIRAGISLGREDLCYLPARPPRFFLPFWTNMFFLAIWAGLTAWVVLTMEPGPSLLAGQIVAGLFFGLIIGSAWLFLTVICAILRAGQH